MKQLYPTNPEVDFEELLDYTEAVQPEEHQPGCAFGQPDGRGSYINECYCSKYYIQTLMDIKRN